MFSALTACDFYPPSFFKVAFHGLEVDEDGGAGAEVVHVSVCFLGGVGDGDIQCACGKDGGHACFAVCEVAVGEGGFGRLVKESGGGFADAV